MASSSSEERNHKNASSLIDELQFDMDDDQPMVETSGAEKSLSMKASAEQSDTADEIWRNIENNRVRFPTNRDDRREGLKRTTTLKSPPGAEGEVVVSTTDDSSNQSTPTSPTGTDGGGRDGESSDKEKAGRGSLENKSILKPSPSVGTSLLNLVNEGTGAKASGTENGSPSMMDEAWERLRSSFVYFQKKPVGTLAAVDPSAEALNYNQVHTSIIFD